MIEYRNENGVEVWDARRVGDDLYDVMQLLAAEPVIFRVRVFRDIAQIETNHEHIGTHVQAARIRVAAKRAARGETAFVLDGDET